MAFVTFTALFALDYARHDQYDGWKSYFVCPCNRDQMTALYSLTHELQLDFLSVPHWFREGVVLVKPKYQKPFTRTLHKLRIRHRIHADDVKAQLQIEDENIEAWMKQSVGRHGGKYMPYDGYQRLHIIYDYMHDIAVRHRNTTTLMTASRSFEGRPIKYLKISTTNFRDKRKPVIFIDAGIHAREWIAPPTVTWAIRKLTEDVTDTELLHNFDWILMPVVNPDGYEFTFTNTRFWRKTRSNNTHVRSKICPGVDGNRNFNFLWNTVGTSREPCDDDYAGNLAFSEVETQAVKKILEEHLPRIALYITMHSYGSMILYPWGNKKTVPKNVPNLHAVAIYMADGIHRLAISNFPNYVVGSGVMVLPYEISGSSMDYALHIGVPLSYTIELPGISKGFKGFQLHPYYIEQVCRETWAGISTGAKKAKMLFKRYFQNH